jgi:hypothetical protein
MKWDSKTYSKLHVEMSKGFAQMMRGILLTLKPAEEWVAQKNPETSAQTSKDILGDVWDEHLGTLHIQRKVSVEGRQQTTIPHSTEIDVCIADPWSQDHVLIIPRETAEKILVLGCPAPTPPNEEERPNMREHIPAGKWIESLPRKPN